MGHPDNGNEPGPESGMLSPSEGPTAETFVNGLSRKHPTDLQ